MQDYPSALIELTKLLDRSRHTVVPVAPKQVPGLLLVSAHIVYKTNEKDTLVVLADCLLKQPMIARVNPAALFYILEFAKWKVDGLQLPPLDQTAYYEHRGRLRKEYLDNINCLNFALTEPLPLPTLEKPLFAPIPKPVVVELKQEESSKQSVDSYYDNSVDESGLSSFNESGLIE